MHKLIPNGACKLISEAVEAEQQTLLAEYADQQMEEVRKSVVRNGYLPERTVQTGVCDVRVQVPKVPDRTGSGMNLNSLVLLPYLKHTKSLDELVLCLYLRWDYSLRFRCPLTIKVNSGYADLS